jgi:hypothetical protein
MIRTTATRLLAGSSAGPHRLSLVCGPRLKVSATMFLGLIYASPGRLI